VRWFNDRPGLATGLAIMGFGGGAMVGSPLAKDLMAHFHAADASTPGVAPAMLVMGAIYLVAMLFGAVIVRVPPAGYRPAGSPAAPAGDGHGGAPAKGNVANIPFAAAVRSPQFWLLWVALCVNTTAGISIIEKASPLIQDFFGKALGPNKDAQAATAAGFVGFISLFNAGGRFVWSTVSDYIGRKATFAAFFLLGVPLYALLTRTDANHLNSVVLFVAIVSVLLSIYGGGFSTMPAYLRDVFGTQDLNRIYGLMLTAWSVAGVLGPQLVNGLSDRLIHGGMATTNAYATVYYVMSGLLAIGLVCDLLVRPVKPSAQAA
jgi:Na+/melibiose symporter-like transporter